VALARRHYVERLDCRSDGAVDRIAFYLCVARIASRHHKPHKETLMKKTIPVLALATLFVWASAFAAEPAQGTVKPATGASAAGPVRTGALTQQEKMRACNQQATGKKGQERKAFMKGCLSKKPA
jgi:psiF repeat-containing protein